MEDYEKLTLWQAVRRWPRAVGMSLCVSLNILLWGYDTAIVGNVASMPVFQQVFGVQYGDRYIIPSLWLSLWSVGLPLGIMLGAVVGGYVQDLTGRKWTLGIGSFVSVVAILTCYVADLAGNKQSALLGGKLLEGIAVGVIMCSTQTYLSEIVPARLRGLVFALFSAFQLVGQLIAAVVVLGLLPVQGPTSYRVAIATEWPFSIFPLALAVFVPESPVWLLQKERTQAAHESFRRIHGPTVAADHEDLFEDMSRAVTEERWAAQDRTASYFECFRGANLKRTAIVVFANTIPDLFGLTLIGHASYFLQILGLTHSMSFIFLLLGILLGLLACVGSWWTLLRFSRRSLVLVTLSIVSVAWLAVGIAGCFKSTNVAYFCAAGMMIIVVVAGLGAWPASYVIASETSSLRLRSKTQGVGWLLGNAISCAFGFGVPYLYNSDAANLGGKTGFIYVALASLGVLVTWFAVPELKGLTAVEIDGVFEKNILVRRAETTQWRSVPGEKDAVPLRNILTSSSMASTAYNASVTSGGVGFVREHAGPKDAYESVWKR
ncbi:hypothetical protein LTR91_005573 [Friedmanniomyces endolithicus]|uniref:Major facilitator superfamily (MFS) profile domain-containing protein n=1 Tax=Friedmanniomyces endolithicus TaxID=329885 RepID=A0AAN6KSQ2_9PEZI|nr:hypothetical protein LTR35_008544 [Friedmanniomyces endolithicus]KAK0294706.1 hypothetical protein LTS00_006541 [Friedmanniomyces endolithicus]KAK0322405.1 hypothetical protein LTR82_006364 [Friedmanniomyces endolithicus]KAK0922080.1 hypothetical protein LTR57_008224 [Friedmanniomyces endolithicus]KAK1001002.1 hypothetical protein LTR91_005573 [Friedmanniomyces endolithicus]